MQINEQTNQNEESVHVLRLHKSLMMRWIYFGIGLTALLMGILGIFLPILPTTPFILLAAGCFARTSERFHVYLLNDRIAGPIICEWSAHRSIPRRVKRWAYLMMALSVRQ